MADQIGRMRERVTLQSRSTTRDAAGGKTAGWNDLGTDPEVWADVRYISGVEAIKADAMTSMKRASIRIRFRSDVDETMRVVHRGVALEIRAALPSDDRAWLNLACEAVGNG